MATAETSQDLVEVDGGICAAFDPHVLEHLTTIAGQTGVKIRITGVPVGDERRSDRWQRPNVVPGATLMEDQAEQYAGGIDGGSVWE